MDIKKDIDEYNKGAIYAEIEIENILNEYFSKISKEDLINKLLENQQNTFAKFSSKTNIDNFWKAGYNNSFKNIIYSIENEEESEDER